MSTDFERDPEESEYLSQNFTDFDDRLMRWHIVGEFVGSIEDFKNCKDICQGRQVNWQTSELLEQVAGYIDDKGQNKLKVAVHLRSYLGSHLSAVATACVKGDYWKKYEHMACRKYLAERLYHSLVTVGSRAELVTIDKNGVIQIRSTRKNQVYFTFVLSQDKISLVLEKTIDDKVYSYSFHFKPSTPDGE